MQPDPRLTSVMRSAARAAGLLVTTLGLVVMAGWILGVAELKTILPGFPSMKVNTALAFLICGPALALLSQPRPGRRARRIAFVAVSLTGVLGLVSLAEYAFAWDAGIDQLLFHEPAVATLSRDPHRMALPSAATLVLWAVAVLALDRGKGARRLAGLFSGATAVLGFIAFVGYIA